METFYKRVDIKSEGNPKETGMYMTEFGWMKYSGKWEYPQTEGRYFTRGIDWYLLPHSSESVLTDEKQKYVVGFMFSNDRNNVVLIRKIKPLWQAGKFNGVGGKIEPNETPIQAMVREYTEEAGVAFAEWDNFLTVEYKSCVVYFFKGFSTLCFNKSETREKEQIVKFSLDELPFEGMIYNLNWIINLALDPDIQHVEAKEEWVRDSFRPATLTDEIALEFGEWCIENIEGGKPIAYRDPKGRIYLNMTDLFKYWLTEVKSFHRPAEREELRKMTEDRDCAVHAFESTLAELNQLKEEKEDLRDELIEYDMWLDKQLTGDNSRIASEKGIDEYLSKHHK